MTSDNTRCANFDDFIEKLEELEILILQRAISIKDFWKRKDKLIKEFKGSSNEHNVCKCGHDKVLYHQGGSCSQWNIDHNSVSKDGVVYCPCKKFEVKNHSPSTSHSIKDTPEETSLNDITQDSSSGNISKCCTAEFIENSDICSKCKEHSE